MRGRLAAAGAAVGLMKTGACVAAGTTGAGVGAGVAAGIIGAGVGAGVGIGVGTGVGTGVGSGVSTGVGSGVTGTAGAGTAVAGVFSVRDPQAVSINAARTNRNNKNAFFFILLPPGIIRIDYLI